MANIKISELNELETKHRNDLLPIVNSSNNETEKIKVENLINENVKLIAVSPTAPSECSLGDKYFNTTSNKLYTAIATDTWSSTGENAVEGILYIVFNEQSTYAYNGTTLVSVGGGSGETITQQSTAPENPEENDLWIDTTNGNALKRYNGTSWELVSTSSDAPIGTITPFAGSTIPDGYLTCDGTAISRTTYSDLFAVIGTTYGSGDGSTTFNLPNLKGRVPVGLDGTQTEFDTLGETGGSKYLQEHSHSFVRAPLYGSEWSSTQTVLAQNTLTGPSIVTNTNNAGTGDSGNLQPYIVTNYIIKASKKVALDKGNVVDSLDGSDTDSAPSVRAVNEALVETYSTDEVKTNKVWIDGKPIYRKVLNLNLTSSPSSVSENLSNLNIKTITHHEVVFHKAIQPLPIIHGI